MECKIVCITIYALLSNDIIRTFEATGKANIHIIKNKIQAVALRIKVLDIDQFHEHVNSLTTTLASHINIMPDGMHHLLKS